MLICTTSYLSINLVRSMFFWIKNVPSGVMKRKGPSINDVGKNILDPLSPCPHLEQIYSTKSTQPSLLCLLLSQLPLCEDVLYEWSLTVEPVAGTPANSIHKRVMFF